MVTPGTKPYHHGDLRDAILDRAAAIIGDQGIEALSLRAIARDLGVSHGAPNRHFRSKADLLTALAAMAWHEARTATLVAADDTGSDNPHIRLNAMGRGFLKWALSNPALCTALQHPDVRRYMDPELMNAQSEYQQLLHDVVVETQADGRHPDAPPKVLTLYTNSVPYGLAGLIHHPLILTDTGFDNIDDLVAELIELVVPIKHLTNR